MTLPDYRIYARIPKEFGPDLYLPIGGGWRNQNEQGREFISCKIDLLPLTFTGDFVLHLNDNPPDKTKSKKK